MFSKHYKCLVTFMWILNFVQSSGDSQLLINVKNQGGDVVQETITTNVTEETVTLEFQRSDGTLVTQLIDFRNDVQIIKILILGEEERGQSQYQVMCFVCHSSRSEFIAPDAMAKLRQKNPGAVRVAEEDRGRDNYTMDHWVILEKSGTISKHIRGLCAEAEKNTFVRGEDVRLWAALSGDPDPHLTEANIYSSLKKFPSQFPMKRNSNFLHDSLNSRCTEIFQMHESCNCHLEICIGWYPCGLKYCKNKTYFSKNDLDENSNLNSQVSYRCGIKTCKKCYLFSYYVREKQICLWDE